MEEKNKENTNSAKGKKRVTITKHANAGALASPKEKSENLASAANDAKAKVHHQSGKYRPYAYKPPLLPTKEEERATIQKGKILLA
ncbi:hypothetical protein GF373_13030 [bacterium]|nr:hypothetical protein [bacterium]